MSLSYLGNLNGAILRWISLHRENRSSLTWAHDDGTILIRDRRADLPKADYRLSGFATEIYHALDAPMSLSALARDPDRFVERAELTAQGPGEMRRPSVAPDIFSIVAAPAPETGITFTREQFQNDPSAAIAPLVEAGIIYREDDLYVSLPRAASARHINGGWRQIGI